MVTALLIGSTNAKVGFEAGMTALRGGASAVEAVVSAISLVEANPSDTSVGLGGLPNLDGEVELDASLMDGETLATGAVGGLKGFQDAIATAQAVMNQLPHVMLTGAGADQFAAEMGFPASELLLPESERVWRSRLQELTAGASSADSSRRLAGRLSRDPELPNPDLPDDIHGTVNVIARDRAGNIACGVSTSGWAWKYPGRLGDSPIIGAGNYADNRFGAAACTGRGEMAIRLCTAHSVVTAMRFGRTLDEALTLAALDLHRLTDVYKSEVNIIAIDRLGNPAAVSTISGKTYVVQGEHAEHPEERERRFVPPPI